MDHAGPFRPPIEPVAEVAAPSPFLAGIAAGIGLAAVAAQVWLAQHLEPLTRWRVDARNLSNLALTAAWRWSVPAVCAAALAALLALRVRRPLPYALAAAAAVLLLVLTYVWAMAPFEELAGQIRSE